MQQDGIFFGHLCALFTFNVIAIERDVEMYNWEALQKVINVLQPLNDITPELQKESANAKPAVDVNKYLRMVVSRDAPLQQPI